MKKKFIFKITKTLILAIKLEQIYKILEKKSLGLILFLEINLINKFKLKIFLLF